jgi:hypothetical protein
MIVTDGRDQRRGHRSLWHRSLAPTILLVSKTALIFVCALAVASCAKANESAPTAEPKAGKARPAETPPPTQTPPAKPMTPPKSASRLTLAETVVFPSSSYFFAENPGQYELSDANRQEALAALEARLDKERPSILDNASNYRGQFIGVKIGKDKHRTMFGNFFCGEPADRRWKDALILVKDGGECYFQFEYDFEEKRVTKLSINGEA